jgi:hypothetical protein
MTLATSGASTTTFNGTKKAAFKDMVIKGIPLEQIKGNTAFDGCSAEQVAKYLRELRKDPSAAKFIPAADEISGLCYKSNLF